MKEKYITTYVDIEGHMAKRTCFKRVLVFVFSVVKFLFDRFTALLILVLSLPLMIIIEIAIKIDSKGPVLFTQKRTGKFGKPFYICKFRTMVKENNVYNFLF